MRAWGKPIPTCRTVSAYASLLAAASATIAFGASAAGSAARPLGHSARVVHLQEHGRLKFSSERGATLIERGTAHGTYTATMVVELTIHSKSVTASVTIYPRGGSITASADARYTIVKNLGYFGGTLNLGRGSGRYRHIAEVAHRPLGISGVINRYNFEVEVTAHGEVTGV
jgi:hypothetical protein